MTVVERATGFARWGFAIGFVCGVVYAFGGMVIDLLTVGLNGGTALAFLALAGMPALLGAAAFVVGGLLGMFARVLSGVNRGKPRGL
jgi:hypothetical protein